MDETIGMNIPKNFIPAIERGFQEACEHGLATGHPIVGLRMILKDGEDGGHIPPSPMSRVIFLLHSLLTTVHLLPHLMSNVTHTPPHLTALTPRCCNPQLTLCCATSLHSAASLNHSLPHLTSLLPRLLNLNLPPPHHPVKGCLILWTPVSLRSN